MSLLLNVDHSIPDKGSLEFTVTNECSKFGEVGMVCQKNEEVLIKFEGTAKENG